MSLKFKVGEVVSVPPAGEVTVKINDDGDLTVVSSDGSEAVIGSGINPSDYDGWFQDQIDLINANVTGLTNFVQVKPGVGATPAVLSGPGSADGAIEGGAIANAAAKNLSLAACSIVQGPKTVKWAIAARAKVLVTSGTDFNLLGLINAAGTHLIGVSAYHVVDNGDHYLLYTYDGQEVTDITTVACDTAFHDFVITFDGTTVTLFIDGTAAADITDLTGITTEPMFAGAFGTQAGAVSVARFAYGYIAP